MRALLLLATIMCGGCQTAEIAVNHQMTGIHVVAKFEARDGGDARRQIGDRHEQRDEQHEQLAAIPR